MFFHTDSSASIQFDFVAVWILKIETLAHGVVAHAVDGDASSLKVFLRRAQFIETVPDFDADMIEPAVPPCRRSRRIADLDQQQFVMRAT